MKLNTVITRAMSLVQVAFVGQVRTGPHHPSKDTHSLRVGLYAVAANRSPAVVAAAFCHDVLEDTAVPAELIQKTFDSIGMEVVELVEACTIDPALGDTPAGEDDLFKRVVTLAETGRLDALWIKAADSLDNLRTNHHLKDAETKRWALERGSRWLAKLRHYCPNEKLLIAELDCVIRIQTEALRAA